jgi:hypothetical protein
MKWVRQGQSNVRTYIGDKLLRCGVIVFARAQVTAFPMGDPAICETS